MKEASVSLAGLVLLLVAGIGLSQRSQYGYIYGKDHGIWSLLPYPTVTQITPSATDPEYTLPGNLDILSIASVSASISVDGSKLYTLGRCDMTAQNNSNRTLCKPKMLDFSPAKIVGLESGDTYSVMVLDNGTVYTWGTSNRSMLGLGLLGGNMCEVCHLGQPGGVVTSLTPAEIDYSNMTLVAGEKVIRVVSTSYSVLLLTSEGKVYAFGSNYLLNLGQSELMFREDFINIASPVNLTANPAGKKVVDMWSYGATFLLLDDGSYLCYGGGYWACNGSDVSLFQNLSTPVLFEPPAGTRFSKMFAALNTGFGWDQNGDVWTWGLIRYIPFVDSQDCSARLYGGLCTPRKLSEIAPGSGKITHLAYTDLDTLFATTENNDVWKLSDAPATWEKLTFPLPPGYAPDISRSTMSSDLLFATARVLAPCTPSTPPYHSDPPLACVDGEWTLFAPANITDSTPLVISGHVTIRGNLTLGDSTHLIFQVDSASAADGKPLLYVDGCLDIASDVTIDVELSNQLGTPKKGQTYPFKTEEATLALISYGASCDPPSVESLTYSIKKPKSSPSCKKYEARSISTDSTAGSRGVVNLFASVDSSKCNHWWIILTSVVCGVILIIVTVILVALYVRQMAVAKSTNSVRAASSNSSKA